MTRVWLGLGVAGLLVAGGGGTVRAQVELTGTYVRYVAVGSNGTMLCSTCTSGESMQYVEATGETPSCDAFYPGSPVEGFTVDATPSGGTRVRLTNSGTSGGSFATTAGPTVSGRTITWSGSATSGSVVLDIDQTHEYQMDDRFVRVTIEITNSGTVDLTDVYYLRNADPDHGSCSIGSNFATNNDVRRQPPTDDVALTTSRAGSTGMQLTLGIGAHDPRARVHNGGFSNTDATGEWNSPIDSDGASRDEGVDLIFKEASLAAGASTIFEFFYVWGRTETDVETRFDELGFPSAPCVGLSDGDACTTSGSEMGICRDGRCCTGCWDGTRCRLGTSSSSCGEGGGACASCVDGDACTSDVCTAGTCSNPDAPSGTACDDGLFCTAVDQCDGSGTCVGAGDTCNDLESCTTDSCDESSDSCTNTGLSDGTSCTTTGGASGVCRSAACCAGCWDGVLCRAGTSPSYCGAAGASCASCVDGDLCTSDVCTAGACSNPDAPSGTSCDDGMYCTVSDACDGSGTCVGGSTRSCDDSMGCTTDACDETADTCTHTATSGCIIGGTCVADGTVNATYPCLVCDATRDSTDWSPRAAGTMCGETRCTAGTLQMRTCDDSGTCVSMAGMDCPTGFCRDSSSCEAVCEPGICAVGWYCNTTTGRCEEQLGLGAACDDAAACASEHCVDGVCCADECTGTCERCDTSGACTPVPAGMDPDDECGGAGCDGTGACGLPDAGPRPDAGPPASDAGTDAGTAADASVSPDAGPSMRRDRGGCGCTTPGASPRAPAAWALAAALFLLLRRRRR